MSLFSDIKNASISMDAYVSQWNTRVQSGMKGLSVDERKMLMHQKYNVSRRTKTLSEFTPSSDLTSLLKTLEENQNWIVITEDWCGDSSFNLAIIEAIANSSKEISLNIVERDKDTFIIDQFLTNGGRAIPILLSFNNDGKLLFKWGPRPQKLIDYRQTLVEEGLEKERIVPKLMDAYDSGEWIHTESEIFNLIKNLK